MKLLYSLIPILCLASLMSSGQTITATGAGYSANNAYSLDRSYFLDGEVNGKNQYRAYIFSYPRQDCADCGSNCSTNVYVNWTGTQWQLVAGGSGDSTCALPTIVHSSTAATSTTNAPCGGWSNGMTFTGACDPGCTSVSLVVTDQDNQVVNPTITIGSSFTLSAIGCQYGTVTWSTGSTETNIVVEPTTTTDYFVTCVLGACPAPSTQHTILSSQLLNRPAPVAGNLPATVCVGQSLTVPFSVTGLYPTNNLFVVQLSDTLGKWTNPTAVGMASGTTSGTISAYFSDGFTRHGAYRLRVIATTATGIDSVGIPIGVVSLCSNVTLCETMVSVQSGNWHNPATWSCGRVPESGDEVTIAASHTVTIGANLTALCQRLQETGRLVFKPGAKLRLLGDENPVEAVVLRSPVVLKPGLFVIDEASLNKILWVKGNRVRFQGVPNSLPLSGSGGRVAAPMGLVNGSFAISKPTEKTPFGMFGKVESSFTVNGTSGVETEVILSKATYDEIFSQLDIAWRAVIKLSAKVDFEGKVKGKEPDKNPAKEIEVNLKATATDTVRVTFDFGLRLITSVLESFSVGAAVDNSLRINVESSGKISYKMEQLLYHWQKNKAIWKWIPTGTFVQIPLIFTPRVNIYAVAEASAEYTINGELLNTHQHFDVAKQYKANTGWSDYSIPPTLHPDAQIAYGVKGTLQAGLKVKAGVFFYDQGARDPKSPNEDGETEETLDVVIEATKGISGECTSDMKGVTVSQFISVKPELALKLPIFSRNIEAKLAVAVPNLPLSTSVVNVPFCRPDSNCIALPDNLPTESSHDYNYHFVQQFRKNSQNRLDTLLYSRLYQPHSDSLLRARLDSYIFLYDTLGRPLRIKATGPGKRDQGFVYSGNKATVGYYDENGDLITDLNSAVFEFQGKKISRIHESGPTTYGYNLITDITYYPNGYVKSIDYRDWAAPSTAGNHRSRSEYTYNPAEGTQEVKYFFTTRDTYDADIFHFEHHFTYKTTFDMTYREQAVVITNQGGSAFSGDGGGLTHELRVSFEIGKLIHNGAFFEGKLVRLVEQTFILPRVTPEPTSTNGFFFEYTVDERNKPTGFSYYEKLVNGQVVKRNTDRINWAVCR